MLTNRPPIIVILGHVDHGKTTLLDTLRKTNIAAREAGGITQHIRSFELKTKDLRLMTIIDTPGHAAFSAMRARGSKLADIAILVISAVDGLMPQTKESLDFIRTANIPYVVAFTKTDLPEANVDHVKTQLTENNVVVEDYGGQIPSVSISAKTGTGLPALLELLDLLASLTPPQADPDGVLEVVVLESRHDPKKGPVAVVVVKNGTLSVGQALFQSTQVGKVKSLTSSEGDQITSALPSTPVEILGLTIVPTVGSIISSAPLTPTTYPTTHNPLPTPQSTSANIILKADVAGSLEAIQASLPPEIFVVLAATGEVSESDVLLARTSGAHIISFNQKIPGSVAKLAETEKITIKSYQIIYELLQDLDTLLHPVDTQVITGLATVLAEFTMDGVRVAGLRCTQGQIRRADQLKLMRSDTEVTRMRIKSLRLGKTETETVKLNQEFGAIFSPQVDFQIGDSIMACSDKT